MLENRSAQCVRHSPRLFDPGLFAPACCTRLLESNFAPTRPLCAPACCVALIASNSVPATLALAFLVEQQGLKEEAKKPAFIVMSLFSSTTMLKIQINLLRALFHGVSHENYLRCLTCKASESLFLLVAFFLCSLAAVASSLGVSRAIQGVCLCSALSDWCAARIAESGVAGWCGRGGGGKGEDERRLAFSSRPIAARACLQPLKSSRLDAPVSAGVAADSASLAACSLLLLQQSASSASFYAASPLPSSAVRHVSPSRRSLCRPTGHGCPAPGAHRRQW